MYTAAGRGIATLGGEKARLAIVDAEEPLKRLAPKLSLLGGVVTVWKRPVKAFYFRSSPRWPERDRYNN